MTSGPRTPPEERRVITTTWYSPGRTAAVRPGEYHVVVITRHSAGKIRGAEVMRGKLNY